MIIKKIRKWLFDIIISEKKVIVFAMITRTCKWLFDFIISEKHDDLLARAGTYFFMSIIAFIFLHFVTSMIMYVLVLITGIHLSDMVRYIFFVDAFLIYNDFGIIFLWPFFITIFTFMGKFSVMGRNTPY